MTNLTSLPWLLEPTKNWMPELRGLDLSDDTAATAKLIELSKFSLNESQLNKLGKAISKISPAKETLTPIRLHVIGDLTLDHLVGPIAGSAIRWGMNADVSVSSFGQSRQEVLSDESEFWKQDVDVFFLYLSPEDPIVKQRVTANSPIGGDVSYEAVTTFIEQTVGRIKQKSPKATIVLSTLTRPVSRFFGAMENAMENTMAQAVEKINSYIRQSGYDYIDLDFLSSQVGLGNWYDNKYLDIAKYPFAPAQIPIFADYISRFLAALYGKRKKCLVVDLDNTLWGGVIGDDGVENIEIGHETAKGQAFLRIQNVVKNLSQMGIILAVCSKNDEENARLPFQERPEMVLKEEDFAVFVANWNDKASNIRYIADKLSIGIDSIVFLDDNPAERALVRELAPQVSVIELPDGPESYTEALLNSGLFDAVRFTEEDAAKAEQYKANTLRDNFSESFSSVEDFLRGLDMKMAIQEMTEKTKSRVVQLINKTNQFNMTGKRLTLSDVEEFVGSGNKIFCVSLEDKFGDNGIISLLLCRQNENCLHVENWVMSCRVLKRGVEDAIIRFLAEYAASNELSELSGEYTTTAKNSMVNGLYAKYGMLHVSTNEDNIELFKQDACKVSIVDHQINVQFET